MSDALLLAAVAVAVVSWFVGAAMGWQAGQDRMAAQLIYVLGEVEPDTGKRRAIYRKLIELREARVPVPRARMDGSDV